MKTRIEILAFNTLMATVLAVCAVGCSKPVDSVGLPVASTTVGTDIDDSVITSSVKSALLADADIKSFDFKVETRKGEVLLSGFVDNQAQLDRATAVTRAVSGVKGIQNNVVLKGAPTTVGKKVDAGIITSKVKAALLGDPNIKSFDIAVVTRDDEVLLSGFVDNQAQVDRAMEVARGIEGVRLVRNEMSIKK
ncbi:MAG: BON domain-containing protein [Pseudomonadota bacterium]